MDIKGVIFDMDGLILDTEKLYQKFWIEASKACGFEMSLNQALQLRSLDKNLAKKLLSEMFGDKYDYKQVHDIRVKLMSEYIDKYGVQAKPGVAELVDYLKEKCIKIAIATATKYERANAHLTLAGVRQCFDTIICACELEHGKPYPDVYLYACEKLGLAPNSCIALEDSPNGIMAAYRAGCTPIFVPDKEGEQKPDNAFVSVGSLFEVIPLIEKMTKQNI